MPELQKFKNGPNRDAFFSKSNALFRQLCESNSRQTDRIFFWMMLGQWFLGIGLACIVTPRTWIGATSYVHFHVWIAVVFGGLVSIPAMFAILKWPGTKGTRYIVAISQAVWTGLLIHLTGGRLETHFHAFGSLAFLSLYRDWRVLLITTAVIGLDHAVRGTLWPLSVYGVPIDSTFRFLEHFVWLAWLDVILLINCVRRGREAHDICERRAALELTNAEIEDRIRDRTRELETVNLDLQNEYEHRQKLNDELVEASRKAGMAEVATGILHNVGNVLNSLNVSAQLVSERVRKSPVDRLCKAADLVLEHEHDLESFVSEDNRGKHLPKMMDQLSTILTEDRDVEWEELRNVRDSIAHVREIISSQQKNARGEISVAREVNLRRLIDEAIRMSRIEPSAMQSANVEEKDARLDKHLFLQIVVNLLSNASDSLSRESRRQEELGSEGYCPQISIEANVNGDLIRVVVTDNGTGIPASNLDSIFQHGFTTRATGHGFGLHSSANHAATLGGRLSVQSEGTGKGAKFTLELPQHDAIEHFHKVIESNINEI